MEETGPRVWQGAGHASADVLAPRRLTDDTPGSVAQRTITRARSRALTQRARRCYRHAAPRGGRRPGGRIAHARLETHPRRGAEPAAQAGQLVWARSHTHPPVAPGLSFPLRCRRTDGHPPSVSRNFFQTIFVERGRIGAAANTRKGELRNDRSFGSGGMAIRRIFFPGALLGADLGAVGATPCSTAAALAALPPRRLRPPAPVRPHRTSVVGAS
jgi:hypothetical protein